MRVFETFLTRFYAVFDKKSVKIKGLKSFLNVYFNTLKPNITMMKKLTSVFIFLIAVSGRAFSQDAPGLYDPGTKPQLVSKQFSFTEGPAVDKQGNIFFTDQPNNKIWKYDTDGKLSVFLDSAGRSNGMYFDKKGNLISCADAKDELWSISPKGKLLGY